MRTVQNARSSTFKWEIWFPMAAQRWFFVVLASCPSICSLAVAILAAAMGPMHRTLPPPKETETGSEDNTGFALNLRLLDRFFVEATDTDSEDNVEFS